MKTNTELARTAFRYCGGFAAMFILFTARLSAQQSPTDEKVLTDEKSSMQVIYLQEDKNYLLFKISVDKTGGKKTFIKVSDNNHETVYYESITGDTFTKTLKLPKFGDDKIEFQIMSGKETIRKSFEIKLAVEETYTVSELKL